MYAYYKKISSTFDIRAYKANILYSKVAPEQRMSLVRVFGYNPETCGDEAEDLNRILTDRCCSNRNIRCS